MSNVVYLKIPFQHAILLGQIVSQWNSQSPTAYTIVTGVFTSKEVQAIGNNDISAVETQTGELIPLKYYTNYDFETGEEKILEYNLDHFIVEGAISQQFLDMAFSLNPPCEILDI